MYPGLAKFFKKKKPTLINTIYTSGKPPQQVFDNGRRGTTKVNDLLYFLLAEGFSCSQVYPSDPYQFRYTKGTTQVIVRTFNPAIPHGTLYAFLEQE